MKLLSLLFLPILAFSQAVQYNTTIIINNPPPGNYSPNFIQQSKIFVNGTTYTDSSASVACASSTQVVYPGTNTCVANPNASNLIAFWLIPGNYSFTIQLPAGQILGPFPFIASGQFPTPQFPQSIFVIAVSQLPAASSANINFVYLVTNGVNNTDCSAGGGTFRNWCVSNGTVWSTIGNASGGSNVSSYNTRSGAVVGILSDVTSLFSGCSGIQYLGFDGNCHSASAGGVSSVSSGNLSPLFSTNVTNPTTTPSIAYTLTNAPSTSWFGNASGSSGSPSYNTGTIPSSLIPNTTCSQLPALTGDTTSSAGSCGTTTSKINGTAVPATTHGLKTNGSSQPAAQTSSDVIAEFTGCSGTQYLGADGACHSASGGGGFIQTLVAPVSANFTQNNFNVGSSVVSTQTNISSPVAAISILQHDPSGLGEMAVLLTPVTPPYTLSAAISGIATLSNDWYGICASDGTQLRCFDFRNGQPDGLSFTNFAGAGTGTILGGPVFTSNGPLAWLRIQETMSARIYSYSSDGGASWAQIFEESNTAQFTTSQIGFTAQKRSGTSNAPDVMVTVYSWNVTNP